MENTPAIPISDTEPNFPNLSFTGYLRDSETGAELRVDGVLNKTFCKNANLPEKQLLLRLLADCLQSLVDEVQPGFIIQRPEVVTRQEGTDA